MGDPQQPEIRRSERGDMTQEGRRITREADDPGTKRGYSGPVPPENRPGHRPDEDQDKPEGPPDGT